MVEVYFLVRTAGSLLVQKTLQRNTQVCAAETWELSTGSAGWVLLGPLLMCSVTRALLCSASP